MIDVDRFKTINDKFGHLQGDKALVVVSNLLKQQCREKDFVGRFGGDEFIVIGHADNKNTVNELICAIQQAVLKYNQEKILPFSLSLSIGYALYDKSESPKSIDSVISAADSGMYQKKAEKFM